MSRLLVKIPQEYGKTEMCGEEIGAEGHNLSGRSIKEGDGKKEIWQTGMISPKIM